MPGRLPAVPVLRPMLEASSARGAVANEDEGDAVVHDRSCEESKSVDALLVGDGIDDSSARRTMLPLAPVLSLLVHLPPAQDDERAIVERRLLILSDPLIIPVADQRCPRSTPRRTRPSFFFSFCGAASSTRPVTRRASASPFCSAASQRPPLQSDTGRPSVAHCTTYKLCAIALQSPACLSLPCSIGAQLPDRRLPSAGCATSPDPTLVHHCQELASLCGNAIAALEAAAAAIDSPCSDNGVLYSLAVKPLTLSVAMELEPSAYFEAF